MSFKFITTLIIATTSFSLANATIETQEIAPKVPQSGLYTRQDLEKISYLASLVGLLSAPYGLTQCTTEKNPNYHIGPMSAGLAGALTSFQVASMLDTALEEDRLHNNTTELLQNLVAQAVNFDFNTYDPDKEVFVHAKLLIQTLTFILTKKATMHASKKMLPGETKRINRRVLRAITNALCHTLIYSYDIITEDDLPTNIKAKGILISSILSLLQELAKETLGEIIIRNATETLTPANNDKTVATA